jgi:hypothetical protein
MSPKGAFCVNLVDAHTKKPFKEVFGPDGNVYVEIESNKEYFVLIRSNAAAPRFKAAIFVDGESLGYQYRSKKAGGCSKTLGLRSVKDGENTVHALRFERVSSIYGDDSYRAADDMTVRVDFHTVGANWEYKGEPQEESQELNWNGAINELKGGILSTRGTVEITGPKRSKRFFETGACLASITLHYRVAKELVSILSPRWSGRSSSTCRVHKGLPPVVPRDGEHWEM